MIKISKNVPNAHGKLILECDGLVTMFTRPELCSEGFKLYCLHFIGEVCIGFIARGTIVQWYDYAMGMGIFSKDMPEGWMSDVS